MWRRENIQVADAVAKGIREVAIAGRQDQDFLDTARWLKRGGGVMTDGGRVRALGELRELIVKYFQHARRRLNEQGVAALPLTALAFDDEPPPVMTEKLAKRRVAGIGSGRKVGCRVITGRTKDSDPYYLAQTARNVNVHAGTFKSTLELLAGDVARGDVSLDTARSLIKPELAEPILRGLMLLVESSDQIVASRAEPPTAALTDGI